MKTSPARWCLAFFALCLLNGQSQADQPRNVDGCQISTQQASVENGVIHYRQAGDGSPILLLHGLFAQKEQWDALLCQLSASGYKVIAPDLPGYGQSTGFPLADYKLENQVVLLRQFVNALGLPRFDLAGNSMGGAIAALYARAHPQQVRSLAFIGAPMGVVGWGKGVREAIFEGINPFIPIDVSQLDREISLLFVKPPAIPESIKASLIKDYDEHNRHYQQVWNIVNLYLDVLDRCPKSQLPTLIVWGQNDAIFPVKSSGQLRQCYVRAKRINLSNAGHLPQQETPDEIAKIYLRFINDAAPNKNPLE